MNKQFLLYSTLLPLSLSGLSYAETISVDVRDAKQTDVKMMPLDQQQIKEDLLRKENLATLKGEGSEGEVKRHTAKQLLDNPAELERLLLNALVGDNKPIIPTLAALYEMVPSHDVSLLEWSKAVLLTDYNLNDSVTMYRSLIAKFPNNDYIRFQLARVLFYNQEYEAAKVQFEKLRSSDLSENDKQVFDQYLTAIEGQDRWNFSMGVTGLQDKNLANAAKEGTEIKLPNGNSFSYATPRQEGTGIALNIGADKRWGLSGGKFAALHSNLYSKYYWDNKKYNEVNAHIGLGYGYSDARFSFEFIPYVDKRWYSGGANMSEALKRYSNTYGAAIESSYWLNQNWKYSFYYDYGYEKYDRDSYAQQYDGSLHSLSNTVMYLANPKQYWAFGVDLSTKKAKSDTNSYNRGGVRLIWGQEWPKGFSTNITIGAAKRNYKEADFFGAKQKNDEYFSRVSLWHKEFHYAGFTPRLTWSYTKTKSNVPIYSYNKNQVFVEVSKTF